MGGIFSVSVPLDQSVNNVFQWLEEKRSYIHKLEKNLEDLKTTMEELKAKRSDLSARLTREEDRGRKRLNIFQVWLTRVDTIEKEVSEILSAKNAQSQRLCLCGFCSKSLKSSYRYGKSVLLTLREVEKLKSIDFEVISEESYEVEERQLPPTIVGQEIMLDKAWNHLMKDGVGIMGLYGMGGVGKTTLLTQINNKFSNDRCGFDYVIWVVVSKELHIEKIQDDIAQNVGFDKEEWNQKGKSQKTNKIYNFLRKKRFVLFLDDIWEKVDLAEIGVPFPKWQNKCKVAFTTRSQDVCARMRVENQIEVKCLAENDAFDLFQKKIGKIKLERDPEMMELAKIVAKKCCGLPLALDVIGETMSCKETTQEWRHAIEVLTTNAADFSDMEDKILPLLKYSYDSLTEEHVKSCLLYCALFPEDEKISKNKLIEYWTCEGIIDGNEGTEKAKNKGYEIIGSLVHASLLIKDGIAMVYMHDVVREMALWIASELGMRKEAFVVHSGVRLHGMPKVENWSAVRRMSLMENKKIHHLVGSPNCMELTTLLVQNTKLIKISNEFFNSMPKLVVLDLSGNFSLTKLPGGISELISLQYFNLSYTAIRHLPKGLQELKKLIHLNLEKTHSLQSISGISSLHNLKVLKLKGSGFSWDLNTVKELETLEQLEILTTIIDGSLGQQQILRSYRLMSCASFLKICEKKQNLKPYEVSLPDTMDKLCEFEIRHCSISEMRMGKMCSFSSLVQAKIKNCKYLRELTCLMFAPNLKRLEVEKANQLEYIINREKACKGEESVIIPFPKLEVFVLKYLSKLKDIYWSPLPFPCLHIFAVFECPNLKKLPFDSKSGEQGEGGLIIRYGPKKWIEGLEWEDEASKTCISASCFVLPPSFK